MHSLSDQDESSSKYTDCDVAWAAGVIEGEGTFSISKTDKSIRVIVRMTDEDVVRRIYDLFGGAFSGPYAEQSRMKPIWTWSMGKRSEIIPFLKLILPYMGKRRTARINELLNHHEMYPPGRERVNAVKHGSLGMYTNNACRCEMCVSAIKGGGR